MNQAKISVFLVTLNEAERIAEVIHSVSTFDEVIVVDSGSTDGTPEIARDLDATVYLRDWLGYAKQKALAADLCANDWLLNIDGDEVMTEPLAQELKALASREDIAGVRIPINDFMLDHPLHRLSRKRKIVRMFRRNLATYPVDRSVHENLDIKGVVINAESELHHFGYNRPKVYFAKHIKYAELRACDKRRAGKRGSVIKLLLAFPFTFTKVLFFRGMIFSGYRGLLVTTAESMYALLKEAFLIRLTYSQSNY